MNWTKKDVTKLKKMWNKGTVVRVIAESFPNRSVGTVTAKLYSLRKAGDIDGRTKKTNKKASKKTVAKKAAKEEVVELGPLDETAAAITSTVDELSTFLLNKNKQYGDSALQPIRIFSKASVDEQIKVRIDDKLNRLIQGNESIESDEDVIMDLIGYLVLLLIHVRS